MKSPVMNVIVELDENGYIARNPNLPLYGYGDDKLEAIEMLQREIKALYEELISDDNYTDDWFKIRDFLSIDKSNKIAILSDSGKSY